MSPFDVPGLRQPSKVHFLTELSNVKPKQVESSVQATPHSPSPLTAHAGFRIGADSLMCALLNVSGNDITVTTVITRPTAAVKYNVRI